MAAQDVGFRAVPLSDDQKALLRLLAQREEGYRDIGALMGLDVEEVRARVRAALAELAAEPSPTPPPLAEPSPPPAAEPAPPAPAELPPVPPPEPAPPAPAQAPFRGPASASADRPSSRGGRPTPRFARAAPGLSRLPQSAQRRRLLLVAGGMLAVVAAVLIVVALTSGESGGSGTSGSGATGAGTAFTPAEAGSLENKKLTQAVLEPVGGGNAEGRAVLGKLGKEVVLEVVAKGLEPSAPGESYAIWLYHSPKFVLRVGAARVGKSGGLAVRLPIPVELLSYIATGAFGQIYVSATPEAAYKAEVEKAKSEHRLPAYTGTTVLRGAITGPTIGKTGNQGK